MALDNFFRFTKKTQFSKMFRDTVASFGANINDHGGIHACIGILSDSSLKSGIKSLSILWLGANPLKNF